MLERLSSHDYIVNKIMRTIPILTLKDNIIQIYQLYVEVYGEKYTEEVFNHAELDPEDEKLEKYTEAEVNSRLELIIESGFNIFILMSWFLDHQDVLNEEDDELQIFLKEFEEEQKVQTKKGLLGNLKRLASSVGGQFKGVYDKIKDKKLGKTMKRSEIYKEAMRFFR